MSVDRFLSISVVAGAALSVTCFATYAMWKFLRRRRRAVLTSYAANKRIFIINTPEEWDPVYILLQDDLAEIKVLGLDCEWVRNKRVALLQLASPSGLCVLVRLFKLWPTIPHSLQMLLADKSVLKVGVAVVDDAKRLHHDYGLIVNGCVDLRHVLRRIRGVFKCTSKGLRGLSIGILGVDISKDGSVRCGNWEAETYTKEQIEYAATDAAVAVDIFLQLVYTKINISNYAADNPGDSSVHHVKDSQTVEGASDTVDSLSPVFTASSSLNDKGVIKAKRTLSSDTFHMKDFQHEAFNLDSTNSKTEAKANSNGMVLPSVEQLKYFDTSVDETKSQSEKNPIFERNYNNVFRYHDLREDEKENFWKVARSMCQGIIDTGYNFQGSGSKNPTPTKQVERKSTAAYSTRKRPLWDNCRLEAPDGQPLCTCDVRKAQWYLDKGLGEKVCEDPLTVRLTFEPADRPESERNYYLQEKENICVVCGNTEDYIRKFVVPFEYRKYFPGCLKNHSSHDVLLLCVGCHRRSCDFDSSLRLQLATECDAPVESGASAKTVLDHELRKMRSAGRALKLNRESIPKHRVAELEEILLKFYGIDVLTEEYINMASDIEARQTSDNYVPHGKQVVRYMARNGGLLAFQAIWRQHFLDTMNPQFLPAYWSVDFVPEAWNHDHA